MKKAITYSVIPVVTEVLPEFYPVVHTTLCIVPYESLHYER